MVPRSQSYTIPGNPIPLARPRFGQARVWDSQKGLKFTAGLFIRNQHGDQPLFTGPLTLNVTFFLPRPKTQSKDKIGKPSTSKPDLDNLIKFTGDIANGVLFADDCIISCIIAQKVYDLDPRTEFTITEIR